MHKKTLVVDVIYKLVIHSKTSPSSFVAHILIQDESPSLWKTNTINVYLFRFKSSYSRRYRNALSIPFTYIHIKNGIQFAIEQ